MASKPGGVLFVLNIFLGFKGLKMTDSVNPYQKRRSGSSLPQAANKKAHPINQMSFQYAYLNYLQAVGLTYLPLVLLPEMELAPFPAG